MRIKSSLFILGCSLFSTLSAQSTIGYNWYVQVGGDMSLQNPYGCNFTNVFPNGKSFGVDAAIGKWFTPELGVRAKMNRDNGISLFENKHANWLAPFYKPGVNMDKGGFLTFVGDLQLDVTNLFMGYDEQRIWNMQIFPRAGFAYNFGVEKGTPLIGLGIGNTWKLTDRYGIYFDVAYNGVSSGFTGDEGKTGTGSNSNGFFDFNVGVQYNIGKRSHTYSNRPNMNIQDGEDAGWKNGLWNNWFVQADLDMVLHNPYKCNFSHVFPKGKSFGVNFSLGKWFSPEIGVRARISWENGLPFFENGHLEWVATDKNSTNTNMEDGGSVAPYLDVMFNLNNSLFGYDVQRNGSFYTFARAGLISNRSLDSRSPLVGAGWGYIYRLTDRLGLYADMAYQVTTSEYYYGVSMTGMKVSAGSNGFFDFHLGVQWNL